jgi:hypothetical protein
MTQYPLVPFFNMLDTDTRTSYRPETEREIFARIARNMRDDQRRARRSRVRARLRRIFAGGPGVAPGSRRVARNS